MEISLNNDPNILNLKLKDLFKKHDLRLKKRLGQNFLVSKSIFNKIINSAELVEDDTVVEIGAGLGILTHEISKLTEKVYAIEIDRKLCSILSENLAGVKNVKIIEKNCLQIDFKSLLSGASHVKVIGNLPYYIVTPIIFHLFKYISCFKMLVLMVQKEVAERIISAPDSKKYSPLSIAVQLRTVPEIVSRVPSSAFIPQPKVDSCILKLIVRDRPLINPRDEELFCNVVRKSFTKRRKMIKNSLNIPPEMFKNINIDCSKRPENLSIEDFGRLADIIYENKINY